MPQRQNRAVPQKPCSAPPKRRPPAYDHKPGTAADQARRRTRQCVGDARPVRVILPDEPPRLTPAAARALLRILLRASRADAERKEQSR
jgi:hypothetical protein